MSTIGRAHTLEHLHRLIKRKHIGKSEEYAAILHISRSCLFNYIEELEISGAQVKYNRIGKYFEYTNEFEIQIIISRDEP
jgi:hypothetical protein